MPSPFDPSLDPHDLAQYDRAGMVDLFKTYDLPAFRANQIWRWLYVRGEKDFAKMTDLAKDLRKFMADTFHVSEVSAHRTLHSMDGTVKWLIDLADGEKVETVFIPESDRGTLCISSQVGCTLTCKFCHTGTQRLVRNLSPAEIVGQVMLARRDLGDHIAASDGRRRITNIVLMGMGEPLYNYENVATAMRILMDGDGLGFSKRRITLSTSGVVPEIERTGAELGVNLAISLHATTDEVRNDIMPINKKYPLASLLDACRGYPLSRGRRITFEYVMLKDVNDSIEDAKRLVKILRGIPAKMNLIPFNPWPGSDYECSDPLTIAEFAEVLNKHKLSAPIRTPRGDDIFAACGQLKTDSVRLPKRKQA